MIGRFTTSTARGRSHDDHREHGKAVLVPRGARVDRLGRALNTLIDEIIQNDQAAIAAIEAFIVSTQAQSGHRIPTLDADNLIEQAEQIILFIPCP